MIETATSAIPSPAAARTDGAAKRLHRAVRRNPLLTPSGMSEYVFSRLFRSLVYAQIWEDPEVDMAALQIAPGNSIVTIASGGCNALSYLVADPTRIEAVDLNPAHVAFNRLKLAAAARVPSSARRRPKACCPDGSTMRFSTDGPITKRNRAPCTRRTARRSMAASIFTC